MSFLEMRHLKWVCAVFYCFLLLRVDLSGRIGVRDLYFLDITIDMYAVF